MKSAFSLVETLFSCALLASVLVPTLTAFHAHSLAGDRMSARLEAQFAYENLSAETWVDALCASNTSFRAVRRFGRIMTTRGDAVTTQRGNALLFMHRYDIAASVPEEEFTRRGFICATLCNTNKGSVK